MQISVTFYLLVIAFSPSWLHVFSANASLFATAMSKSENSFASDNSIFKLVAFSPEKFTVHIQATDSFILANFKHSVYFSCHSCSFLFLSPSIRLNRSLERFTARHVQQCNLIFVENYPGGKELINFHNIQTLGYFISTIYLIYYRHEQLHMLPQHQLLPATKICIREQVTNSKSVEIGFVLCGGYCTLSQFEMDATAFRQVLNPVNYHKNLFWNGNDRKVPVIGVGHHRYLNRFLGRGRYFCFGFVGTAISDVYNYWTSLCDGKLVAVLQLAKTHNISFEIVNPTMENEYRKFDNTINSQSLGDFVLNWDPHQHQRSGMLYAERALQYLVYCKLRLVGMNYEVWINALTWRTWTAVIVSIVVIKMQFFYKIRFLRLA